MTCWAGLSLPVVVSSAADTDIRLGIQRLEELRPGLGREFLLSLDVAIAQISAFPDACAFLRKPFRRVVIRRFHYLLVYVARKDRAEVIAVMDCRRDPATLHARLP